MNFSAIRSRFFWQVFFAFIIVLFLFLTVLLLAFQISIPTSFGHHMAEMNEVMNPDHKNHMGGMMGNMMSNEIFAIFNKAMREALLWAALIAGPAAFIISAIISHQLVKPVRQLSTAADQISKGNFQQRVEMKSYKNQESLNELETLGLSFNQMAASLEKSETLRRQMIGDVSHELRTPLTTIQGNMEGLIDKVIPAEQNIFEEIHKEAKRLSRLVDDLQELSLVESEGFKLVYSDFNLLSLLYEVELQIASKLKEKNLELRIDTHKEIGNMMGDADRMKQILINLIDNAISHSNSNDFIDIKLRSVGETYEISISDHGVGIDVQHIDHIFDRFYRADRSRARKEQGGSGIGLTICQQLIEAHGGKISVMSAGKDQGSTFELSIPTRPTT